VSEQKAPHVVTERGASAGLISLNRPDALNALSLTMVRQISQALLLWRDDPDIKVVALRGSRKAAADGAERWFGHFCAGGDIRFFHDAASSGDPALEDFFTEEYALNHLIQTYGKPIVAFMDGVVMGGGMGLCQGTALRIVTENTRMAMPETKIGLFPDVGGGYFLKACPGASGVYLALTGEVIDAQQAMAWGLADAQTDSTQLAPLWQWLAQTFWPTGAQAIDALRQRLTLSNGLHRPRAELERAFSQATVAGILEQLDTAGDAWSTRTASDLRARSPLMLHVTLEQLRRARGMSLADDLRMERDLVWRCFHHRPMADCETMEGIRALAVDKDHRPRWKPAQVEAVDPQEVAAFFDSPWPLAAHPLRHLR
jgi:enoyl-CoA hydratase/carnithine racemase